MWKQCKKWIIKKLTGIEHCKLLSVDDIHTISNINGQIMVSKKMSVHVNVLGQRVLTVTEWQTLEEYRKAIQ